MKKLLTLVALLAVSGSFVGCGETAAPTKPATPPPAVNKGPEAGPTKTETATDDAPKTEDKADEGAPAEDKKEE